MQSYSDYFDKTWMNGHFGIRHFGIRHSGTFPLTEDCCATVNCCAVCGPYPAVRQIKFRPNHYSADQACIWAHWINTLCRLVDANLVYKPGYFWNARHHWTDIIPKRCIRIFHYLQAFQFTHGYNIFNVTKTCAKMRHVAYCWLIYFHLSVSQLAALYPTLLILEQSSYPAV